MRRGLVVALLVFLAAPSAAADPSPEAIAEARGHYKRGLEAYDAGRYDAALAEFLRADQLAPSYRILQSIGLVQVQLGDNAGAVTSFERYLAEGGAQVDAATRAKMEKQIAELRGHVASILVTTRVLGATITVDDVVAGTTPLAEPIVVNTGRRRIAASMHGYESETRVVVCAEKDRIRALVRSRPPRGASPKRAPVRGGVVATSTAPAAAARSAATFHGAGACGAHPPSEARGYPMDGMGGDRHPGAGRWGHRWHRPRRALRSAPRQRQRAVVLVRARLHLLARQGLGAGVRFVHRERRRGRRREPLLHAASGGAERRRPRRRGARRGRPPWRLLMQRWPALLVVCAAGCGGGGQATPGGDAGRDAVAVPNDAGRVGDASSTTDAAPPADGATLPSGRTFVDTSSTIAILADQLPQMTDAQLQFAASHYVGTQKQLLPVTQALRAANPNFLVLHYHLSMWQSAPNVDFIIDGMTWGNDYPTVTTHEDWFWHNAQEQRVASSVDGKLLMNVSTPGFQQYWATSLAAQVQAGQYDAVFFDSASPALLQGECGTADPDLAGTAARDTVFSELGGTTWIDAWQSWIQALNGQLAAQGIPLIPNTGPFITSWDNTRYDLTAGIFSEGFADPSFAESDWQASTNELLLLAAEDKIMILQNYLSGATDVATRLYYLGNYLLVKGHHTYLDYFAKGPLEWYPEWQLDLGSATTAATTSVADLLQGGVYRRDFEKGSVLVNPSASPVTVTITGNLVVPSGGGAVDSSGDPSGTLGMMPVTSVTLPATSAEIVLR